jgi:hypothetical protein
VWQPYVLLVFDPRAVLGAKRPALPRTEHHKDSSACPQWEKPVLVPLCVPGDARGAAALAGMHLTLSVCDHHLLQGAALLGQHALALEGAVDRSTREGCWTPIAGGEALQVVDAPLVLNGRASGTISYTLALAWPKAEREAAEQEQERLRLSRSPVPVGGVQQEQQEQQEQQQQRQQQEGAGGGEEEAGGRVE